jgi:serine/threonine protein kinase
VRQLPVGARVHIPQQDLLHRDIKTHSSAVYVRRNALVVKVCDFGLAAGRGVDDTAYDDGRLPLLRIVKYNSRYTQAIGSGT